MNPVIKIPENTSLEMLTLGTFFVSIDAVNYGLSILDDSDFADPKHKIIFSEIKSCYLKNKEVDSMLIFSNLKYAEKIDSIGGSNYFFQVAAAAGLSSDYEGYCKELRNISSLRKLIILNQQNLHDLGQKDANAESIIGNIQSKIYQIQGLMPEKLRSGRQILDAFSEHGDFEKTLYWRHERVKKGLRPYDGIPSGYDNLDHTFGYFRPGAIYYIGARTSMGKTTFLLNLVRNMLGKKIPVGVFSLELPATLMAEKLLAIMADIKFDELEDSRLSPEKLDRFQEVANQARTAPLFIDDQEDVSISKLRARAKRMQINHGIKVLFIDYLTRIKSDTKYPSKHLQVDEVSKGLQSLAKELNIPIICLAQLNRGLLSRSDMTPNIGDFRESGSIEEDADGCMLLHRPEYYDSFDRPGIVQVIVAKNRIRGKLKKIEFMCNPHSEKYVETEAVENYMRKITNPNEEPESDWVPSNFQV